MRTNKGFTIIELLIVIVIIGILVAITAVSYTGITNSAKTAEAQSNARNVKQAALACQAKDTSPAPATTAALTTCSGISLTGINIGTPNATNGKDTVGLTYATPSVTYWDFGAGKTETL